MASRIEAENAGEGHALLLPGGWFCAGRFGWFFGTRFAFFRDGLVARRQVGLGRSGNRRRFRFCRRRQQLDGGWLGARQREYFVWLREGSRFGRSGQRSVSSGCGRAGAGASAVGVSAAAATACGRRDGVLLRGLGGGARLFRSPVQFLHEGVFDRLRRVFRRRDDTAGGFGRVGYVLKGSVSSLAWPVTASRVALTSSEIARVALRISRIRSAELRADLGQLVRPEDHQRNDENKNELHRPDAEYFHGQSFPLAASSAGGAENDAFPAGHCRSQHAIDETRTVVATEQLGEVYRLVDGNLWRCAGCAAQFV